MHPPACRQDEAFLPRQWEVWLWCLPGVRLELEPSPASLSCAGSPSSISLTRKCWGCRLRWARPAACRDLKACSKECM